jgi:amidophosphoribosyltransferase
MCGVVGIFAKEKTRASLELYDSLISLQHRGQDSAGIITFNEGFHLHKDLGLVRNVFNEESLFRLKGYAGIGHVRYSTIGDGTASDAQPFLVSSPYGIAMAHNGNVTNFKELKKELAEKDLHQINSGCDVEIILNVFASALARQTEKDFKDQVFKAVAEVHQRVQGSYSVVAIIAGKGMVAFRDPRGIKPLVIGKRENEYIFSSENVMFALLGFKYQGDVQSGECVFVDQDHKFHRQVITLKPHCPCIFEHVYFARADALIDNISVYKSRLRMGNKLSQRIKPLMDKLKIDVVIPAPSTSNTAALTLAYDLGVKYREGLIKNHFIGRTFIMENQEIRKKSVKYKLSPVELEIKDKNVLLLDDSIVRGNTSKEIVKLLRDCGAKKVYFAVAAPPIKFPCVYGIDMPTRQELIANNKETIAEIQKEIGADLLIYQELDDLVNCVHEGNPEVREYCTACFSGKYPTDISSEELLELEEDRLAVRQKQKENQMKIFK